MARITMTNSSMTFGPGGAIYRGPRGVLRALPCSKCGSTKVANLPMQVDDKGLQWSGGKCGDCGADANIVLEAAR